jgi:hypothetical protein
MASTIGIKIANGEFYPILEENATVKKRLILTTVHNKQKSVHIDLYKSNTRTIGDARYIGSLVVENIKAKFRGEPSIALTISSNKKGEITADAVDLGASSGLHHCLNVSLNSLAKNNQRNEESDFEIAPPVGLYGTVSDRKRNPLVVFILLGLLLVIGFAFWFSFFNGKERFNSFFSGSMTAKVKPSSDTLDASKPLVKPVIPDPAVKADLVPEPPAPVPETKADTTAPPVVEVGEPAVKAEPVPEPTISAPTVELDTGSTITVVLEPEMSIEAKPTPEPEEAETLKPTLGSAVPEQPLVSVTTPLPGEPPIIEAPVSLPPRQAAPKRTRPSPPVASYKVPTAIPRGGIGYKIRWGDTLWDISEAFYRNPWLYPRIARFNNIRNPDLIISGNTIRIPPRR